MADKKIILNCDPGTDDSVCIIMGLMHPEIELLAVCAESGNLTSDKSSRNALMIMELMGRSDIPVSRGMLHPPGPSSSLRSLQPRHRRPGQPFLPRAQAEAVRHARCSDHH